MTPAGVLLAYKNESVAEQMKDVVKGMWDRRDGVKTTTDPEDTPPQLSLI